MDRLIDLLPELWEATLETLYVSTSGFILGGLAGLILGMALYATGQGASSRNARSSAS